MSRVGTNQRLRCETVSLNLDVGNAIHPLEVSLAYDKRNKLREIVFVGRGKIGQGLDILLHDLGVKLSRAIQNRDPETGDTPPKEVPELDLNQLEKRL